MGHTKLAISLPDELFEQLVKCAQEQGVTRSAFLAAALRTHFERESAADFIARMNAAYGDPSSEEEVREEAALLRAGEQAARRISQLLREGETESW
jgi:metal-responsive CopG/Arc/MetJ family transcriptional regulator